MADPDSAHDFGKTIIPTLMNNGEKLVAFKFEGYWKDVGTIDSLWEANMDLLDENCDLNLDDPTWKIYTEDAVALPAYIGPDASIDRAYITQGTSIDGYIKNSVAQWLAAQTVKRSRCRPAIFKGVHKNG